MNTTTIFEPRQTTEAGVWTAIGYDWRADTFVVIGWAPYFTGEADDPERGSVLHTASRKAHANRFAAGFRVNASKRVDELARLEAEEEQDGLPSDYWKHY